MEGGKVGRCEGERVKGKSQKVAPVKFAAPQINKKKGLTGQA